MIYFSILDGWLAGWLAGWPWTDWEIVIRPNDTCYLLFSGQFNYSCY
jgi:hypothetical protein